MEHQEKIRQCLGKFHDVFQNGAKYMARKAVVTEEPVPTPEIEVVAETTEETPIRRRRRRKMVVHASQATNLIESVLLTRKGAPVSADGLAAVIAWARGVHAEAIALREIAARPRAKRGAVPVSPERVATHELHRTLLDGVLNRNIGIDVSDSGQILFVKIDAE